MKKYYFLAALILTITLVGLNSAVAKQESKESLLTFRANKSALWFKHPGSETEKTKKDTVEASLKGKLYDSPQQIIEINKEKEVNRDTALGIVISYFSSSKKGNANWIASNFVDEEKDEIKKLLTKKEFLKERQKSASKIESEYLVGEAKHKDYTILFIEQRYKDSEKIIEPLACKKTKDGWRITNSLSNDETFDIIFAALASGEVTNNNGITLRKNSLAAKIRKPEIKIVR